MLEFTYHTCRNNQVAGIRRLLDSKQVAAAWMAGRPHVGGEPYRCSGRVLQRHTCTETAALHSGPHDVLRCVHPEEPLQLLKGGAWGLSGSGLMEGGLHVRK